MLSGLRQGAPIYVLYKNELKTAIGEVVAVSNPVPQYGTTYNAGILAQPKTVVDVRVRIGSETVDFQKLPADQSIADFGPNGIVISETRDGILAEIDAYQKRSETALAETPRHEQIIAACKSMRSELDPAIRKEAEQTAEIANLKKGMADMRDDLADIKALLSKSLNRKLKEE